MGFEDEAEQSKWRRCRELIGRSKRTNELTSSIVSRGTSFHRSVELACSPIVFDPARFSCCCRGLFPAPAELSAINPYAFALIISIAGILVLAIALYVSHPA
jgi:hypothetical protein